MLVKTILLLIVIDLFFLAKCTKNCQNGAACVNNLCVCSGGWAGDLCDRGRHVKQFQSALMLLFVRIPICVLTEETVVVRRRRFVRRALHAPRNKKR